MDYFGITVGGGRGGWFPGMDKEERNDNKYHSLVKAKNYCLIWTRWWNRTNSQAEEIPKEMLSVLFWKTFFFSLLLNILLIYGNVWDAHRCLHTFKKASYSHQEHSSGLKPKAYTILSFICISEGEVQWENAQLQDSGNYSSLCYKNTRRNISK